MQTDYNEDKRCARVNNFEVMAIPNGKKQPTMKRNAVQVCVRSWHQRTTHSGFILHIPFCLSSRQSTEHGSAHFSLDSAILDSSFVSPGSRQRVCVCVGVYQEENVQAIVSDRRLSGRTKPLKPTIFDSRRTRHRPKNMQTHTKPHTVFDST